MPESAPHRHVPSRPLFGRSELHQAIGTALAEARRAEGQLLLLVGETGVGKSTMLATIAADAHELGFLVLRGRALPFELPRPFLPFQEALRMLEQQKVERPAPPESSVVSLFLAPYDTDPNSAISGGDPLSSEDSVASRLLSHLAGPTARVEESQATLFDQFAQYLQGLARSDPLLIAIDDLQFADSLTLGFLQQIAGELSGHMILIVATMLPPEDAPARTGPLLQKLLAHPTTHHLDVRRMTEREVGEFAQWLLRGREPGRAAITRWHAQTEGNPLFLETLLRGTGSLSLEPQTPESRDLHEMFRGRIRKLPEADRRVLLYATVLGHEFEFDMLSAATGDSDEERLAEAVDHLVQAGLLRERGNEVYEFVDELMRAEAYGQLTESRRRILHRKVAQSIHARRKDDPAAAFELARQFYLGRVDDRALEYNRRAAELAMRAFDFTTAAAYLERAIESLERLPSHDPALELRLRVELGRVLDEVAEFGRSSTVLTDAVRRARESPRLEQDLALALLWLARTVSDLGEFGRARDLASEAFTICSRLGRQDGLLVAHRILGIAYWRVGNPEEGEKHLRAELALAEQQGDPREQGHAMIDLANVLLSAHRDRWPEARLLYERAEAIFSKTAEHAAQARAAMNLSLLLHTTGEHPADAEMLQRGLEAAELSRSRLWIGYCRLNEAQFRVEAGRSPEARRSLEAARSMIAPLGDQYAEMQIIMIEGMIEEAEGAISLAEARFAQAIEMATKLSLEPELAELTFRRARLALKAGRPADARRDLDAALAAGLSRHKAELLPEAEELGQAIAARSA